MGLTIVTPPAAEPVSVEEAKTHLRVRHADDDVYIGGLIKAAVRHTQKLIDTSLMTQTWRLTLDRFSDAIELPRGPVQSVTELNYVDAAGATQVIAATNYTADLTSQRQWLVRNSGYSWPSTIAAINAVSVTYVAGFDTLPADYEDLRQGILTLVGHWDAHREAVNIGNAAHEIPLAYAALIEPYRRVMV